MNELTKSTQRIIKITQCFICEIEPVCDSYRGTEPIFPSEFIFIHSLERLKQNLKSLLVLFKNNPLEHTHGIGLLYRNIITDLFVVAYLREFTNDKDDLTTQSYDLFNNDLDKSHKFLKKYSGIGGVPFTAGEEFESYQLKNEGTLLNKISKESKNTFPTTSAIFDKFKMSPSKELHHTILKSFDIWSLYSKYEHIGWNSYLLTAKPLIPNEQLREIILCLGFATVSAKASLDMLNKEDILAKIDSLHKQCEELLLEIV